MKNSALLHGYNLYRHDRDRHGGGVAIYLRNHLNVSPVLSLCDVNSNIESLWLNVNCVSWSSSITLGCCYRPPGSPSSSVEHLLSEIEVALSSKPNVVVCGDFNINLLDGTHAYKDRLIDFINTHSLCQPIKCPTRINNSTKSPLDLFLLSNEEFLMSSGVSDLAISDHQMIFLNLSLKCHKPRTSSQRRRNFRKFNDESFCTDLSNAPWCGMELFDCPDDKLFVFEQLVNDCLDVHAPWSSAKRKKAKVLWISPGIQKAIDKKNRLLHKFRKTSDSILWSAYKVQRNVVTRLLHDGKKHYFACLIGKSTSSSMLWKCLKSANPPANKSLEVFTEDHSSIANNFNHHFVSVGQVPVNTSPSYFDVDSGQVYTSLLV